MKAATNRAGATGIALATWNVALGIIKWQFPEFHEGVVAANPEWSGNVAILLAALFGLLWSVFGPNPREKSE